MTEEVDDEKSEQTAYERITGEQFLRGVLNGKYKTRQKNFGAKMEAAKALLPYEKPRLNAVDATVRNVEMTHEEWIASLDQQED